MKNFFGDNIAHDKITNNNYYSSDSSYELIKIDKHHLKNTKIAPDLEKLFESLTETQQPSAKAEGFSAGRRGLNVHPYCFPRF